LENWDVALEPQTAPRPLREVHRDVQRMNDIRRAADLPVPRRATGGHAPRRAP
ncbi:hypothetical protein HCN56_17720, partial [Streptomyces lonarensis]|nr:hypothetical protein [Streptomyces lonarensis]